MFHYNCLLDQCSLYNELSRKETISRRLVYSFSTLQIRIYIYFSFFVHTAIQLVIVLVKWKSKANLTSFQATIAVERAHYISLGNFIGNLIQRSMKMFMFVLMLCFMYFVVWRCRWWCWYRWSIWKWQTANL